LPWIATIDKFQHWIYSNPTHTAAERKAAWLNISNEFSTGMVDYTDYEDFYAHTWQKQLHLFEVPFYYIEYGIAQLGAIGVWKNAIADKAKAIEQYKQALALGYTKTIGEIYATAGIRFDFSKANIRELMQFVKDRLQQLL
jgi:oligoendopeptidase F